MSCSNTVAASGSAAGPVAGVRSDVASGPARVCCPPGKGTANTPHGTHPLRVPPTSHAGEPHTTVPVWRPPPTHAAGCGDMHVRMQSCTWACARSRTHTHRGARGRTHMHHRHNRRHMSTCMRARRQHSTRARATIVVRGSRTHLNPTALVGPKHVQHGQANGGRRQGRRCSGRRHWRRRQHASPNTGCEGRARQGTTRRGSKAGARAGWRRW